MVAASPQRERYRDWLGCIDNMAFLVIAQAGDIEKVRAMIKLACDEEESRLTGVLIAQYGYAQGNAAVRALKRSAEARFQSKIAQRDRPPSDPNFVETIDAWNIRRITGGCIAIRSEIGTFSIGKVGTILRRAGDTDSIFFVLAGSAVSYVDKKIREAFTVPISRWVRQSSIETNTKIELVPALLDDNMVYITKATSALLTELSEAEEIQFQVPSGWAVPHAATFPVSGLAEAWAAVQRCAAR